MRPARGACSWLQKNLTPSANADRGFARTSYLHETRHTSSCLRRLRGRLRIRRTRRPGRIHRPDEPPQGGRKRFRRLVRRAGPPQVPLCRDLLRRADGYDAAEGLDSVLRDGLGPLKSPLPRRLVPLHRPLQVDRLGRKDAREGAARGAVRGRRVRPRPAPRRRLRRLRLGGRSRKRRRVAPRLAQVPRRRAVVPRNP